MSTSPIFRGKPIEHWMQPSQCTSLQFLPSPYTAAVAGCSDGTIRFLHGDGRTTVACHILENAVASKSKLPVLVATAGNYAFASLARGSKAFVAIELTDTTCHDNSSVEPRVVNLHRHGDAKLRGLGAAHYDKDDKSYVLLTGRGIQNLHVYRFTPPGTTNGAAATWDLLLDTPVNGNTIESMAFTYHHDNPSGGRLLQAVTKSRDQAVRVWDLEPSITSTMTEDQSPTTRRPAFTTVPDTQTGCIGIDHQAVYCTVPCLPHVVQIRPLHGTKDSQLQEMCLPLGHHEGDSAQSSRRRRRMWRTLTHVTGGVWCQVSDGTLWHGPTGTTIALEDVQHLAASEDRLAVATSKCVTVFPLLMTKSLKKDVPLAKAAASEKEYTASGPKASAEVLYKGGLDVLEQDPQEGTELKAAPKTATTKRIKIRQLEEPVRRISIDSAVSTEGTGPFVCKNPDTTIERSQVSPVLKEDRGEKLAPQTSSAPRDLSTDLIKKKQKGPGNVTVPILAEPSEDSFFPADPQSTRNILSRDLSSHSIKKKGHDAVQASIFSQSLRDSASTDPRKKASTTGSVPKDLSSHLIKKKKKKVHDNETAPVVAQPSADSSSAGPQGSTSSTHDDLEKDVLKEIAQSHSMKAKFAKESIAKKAIEGTATAAKDTHIVSTKVLARTAHNDGQVMCVGAPTTNGVPQRGTIVGVSGETKTKKKKRKGMKGALDRRCLSERHPPLFAGGNAGQQEQWRNKAKKPKKQDTLQRHQCSRFSDDSKTNDPAVTRPSSRVPLSACKNNILRPIPPAQLKQSQAPFYETPAKRPNMSAIVTDCKETQDTIVRCTDPVPWSLPNRPGSISERLKLVPLPLDKESARWAQAFVHTLCDCLRHERSSTKYIVDFYRQRAYELERRWELEAVCRGVKSNKLLAAACHSFVEKVQSVLSGDNNGHIENKRA